MATLDAPLSHAELAAMLAEDERMALSFRDSTLADEQAVAIDYYEARPFAHPFYWAAFVLVGDWR